MVYWLGVDNETRGTPNENYKWLQEGTAISVRDRYQVHRSKIVRILQATTISKLSTPTRSYPPNVSCILKRRARTLMTFLPPYSLAFRIFFAAEM